MTIMVKCPKCANICEFGDSKLFGFCNKCGSRLERDFEGNVTVYEKTSEVDEDVLFTQERFDICKDVKIPTRAEFDVESFDAQVEFVMDQIMSFSEIQKDIISSSLELPSDKKLRKFELCYEMTSNLLKQFEPFLKEYIDYGIYDELKSVDETYSNEVRKLSGAMVTEQDNRRKKYWSQRPDEYNELKNALEDAKARKSKLAFFDFQKKWDLDAEILAIEKKLNRVE